MPRSPASYNSAMTLPTGEPLTGRWVILSALTEADLDEMHPILADPAVYQHGYIMHRRPTSPAGSRELARTRFLARQGQADGAGGGRTAYAIRLARDSDLGPRGTLAGTSALSEADLANESIHLGSTLYGPRWWGTQVNPESKLLLLSHCFEDCGYGRVKIQTDTLNTRLARSHRETRRPVRGNAQTAYETRRRHFPRLGYLQHPQGRMAADQSRPHPPTAVTPLWH